jgi:hypothetical protein
MTTEELQAERDSITDPLLKGWSSQTAGGFAAIGSGYQVRLQRRSLAACAQPAQPFSMTTFKVTSFGMYGRISSARYAVLYPPQGFGEHPLAVVQLVFGSAPFGELPPRAILSGSRRVEALSSVKLTRPPDVRCVRTYRRAVPLAPPTPVAPSQWLRSLHCQR